MDYKISKLARYSMPLLATAIVVGCGGSDSDGSDSDGSSAEYVTLNYLRKDANYDGWGVHAFNQSCDGVVTETGWNTPVEPSSISAETGAVYQIEVDSSETCINYIIHKGDDKEVGGDRTWNLAAGDVLYVAQGIADPQSTPVPLPIYDGEKAIFIDETTIAVPAALTADSYQYQLLYSTTAQIAFDNDEKTVSGGTSAGTLTPTTLSAEAIAKYPHLANYVAFTVDTGTLSLSDLLTYQLNFVVSKSDGAVFDATGLQLAPVLDLLYAQDAAQQTLGAIVDGGAATFKLWAPTAQEVSLYLYDENLVALDGNPVAMSQDASGVWSSAEVADHVGKYYRYEVEVYHPENKAIETHQVTDPYSVSLSANSKFSQVVDLAADELKPAEWDTQTIPELARPEQHVIYETHLRDLTISDADTGTDALDGKYTAITETNRYSVQQLQALKTAGLNTIHLMNVFDIATVDEDPTQRVDLDNTVAELCDLVVANAEPDAQQQGICKTDPTSTATLRAVLADADPATDEAQAVLENMRAYDAFNWGYDPFHYTTPEGSYATDANGTTRILQYRTLIKTLHDMGFRVVMDVVYNHTNEAGLSSKSVLDKIVPGYYQRLNANGGVEASTCCSNTATENTMMGKLMTDSLMVWAEQYKIDGFRFDLMGHQPKDLMVDAWAKVKAIDEDNYFYGEGWNFGEVQNNARFVQATQAEMAGTGIGTYSDRLRDAMRGGSPFDVGNDIRINQGFANAAEPNELVTEPDEAAEGLKHAADLIRLGMAGNLKNFVLLDSAGETKRGQDIDYNGQSAGYTLDPQENISYVSKHDNQTLWDNNMYKAATDFSSAERAQMQIIALSAPILGQGLPFLHLGSELLRSKSMQRDSYDSGDWFNAVKFDMSESNWNVGLPRKDKDGDNWDLIKTILADTNAEPTADDIAWTDARFKELLAIRTGSALFSLATAAEVKSRVDFWNTGTEQTSGLIVMSIDDGTTAGADLDPNVDAIVVVINATNELQAFEIAGAAGFELHSALIDSNINASFADSTFSVPALTTAVFVIPQAETQGAGLPINTAAKDYTDIPPLDYTPYVVADTASAMTFISNGIYKLTLELEEGEFAFKFADADGGNVINQNNATLEVASLALTSAGATGALFGLEVTEAGFFDIYIDASNPDAATVKVLEGEVPAPFGDTDLYLRGSISDAAWAAIPSAKFDYVGDSLYTLTFDVAGGEVLMKVANGGDWIDETNFGVAAPLVLDAPLTLDVGSASGNIEVSLSAGSYQFSLDASDKTAPVLTVSAVE